MKKTRKKTRSRWTTSGWMSTQLLKSIWEWARYVIDKITRNSKLKLQVVSSCTKGNHKSSRMYPALNSPRLTWIKEKWTLILIPRRVSRRRRNCLSFIGWSSTLMRSPLITSIGYLHARVRLNIAYFKNLTVYRIGPRSLELMKGSTSTNPVRGQLTTWSMTNGELFSPFSVQISLQSIITRKMMQRSRQWRHSSATILDSQSRKSTRFLMHLILSIWLRRYYALNQYPNFPVHIIDNDPIEVKPDVIAGHWRLDPNGEMECFFAAEKSVPVADFLHEIIAKEGWAPSASRVFVPTFVAECQSRQTPVNDVYVVTAVTTVQTFF